MRRLFTVSAVAATIALNTATFAATPAKPQAESCAAAATLEANSAEYMIAEYEGRLSAKERSRWTSAQLAGFETQLTQMRPGAAIARAVADKLIKTEISDAAFDVAQALPPAELEALINKCHAAYVK